MKTARSYIELPGGGLAATKNFMPRPSADLHRLWPRLCGRRQRQPRQRLAPTPTSPPVPLASLFATDLEAMAARVKAMAEPSPAPSSLRAAGITSATGVTAGGVGRGRAPHALFTPDASVICRVRNGARKMDRADSARGVRGGAGRRRAGVGRGQAQEPAGAAAGRRAAPADRRAGEVRAKMVVQPGPNPGPSCAARTPLAGDSLLSAQGPEGAGSRPDGPSSTRR